MKIFFIGTLAFCALVFSRPTYAKTRDRILCELGYKIDFDTVQENYLRWQLNNPVGGLRPDLIIRVTDNCRNILASLNDQLLPLASHISFKPNSSTQIMGIQIPYEYTQEALEIFEIYSQDQAEPVLDKDVDYIVTDRYCQDGSNAVDQPMKGQLGVVFRFNSDGSLTLAFGTGKHTIPNGYRFENNSLTLTGTGENVVSQVTAEANGRVTLMSPLPKKMGPNSGRAVCHSGEYVFTILQKK